MSIIIENRSKSLKNLQKSPKLPKISKIGQKFIVFLKSLDLSDEEFLQILDYERIRQRKCDGRRFLRFDELRRDVRLNSRKEREVQIRQSEKDDGVQDYAESYPEGQPADFIKSFNEFKRLYDFCE